MPGRTRFRPRRLVRRRAPSSARVRESKGAIQRLRLRRLLLHDVRHRLRTDCDASRLQVRKHRRERRIHARHGRYRRVQRATRARLGPGRHVGLGGSARGEGYPVHLHEGLHRLRRHHTCHRRPLPALALPTGPHERRDDHRRLGPAGDGGGDRAGQMARLQRAPRRQGTCLITLASCTTPSAHPPGTSPTAECDRPDNASCEDHRPPAVRASDTAVETMLYRNWLRGVLGSADSPTAQKYGPALYDATFTDLGRSRGTARSIQRPATSVIQPEVRTMDESRRADQDRRPGGIRVPHRALRAWTGSAPASSPCWLRCMFALFDLTASVLVLLGFLIFRWAVIAAPVLGTVGLMRPASAGFRRLANAVVAALFNIVIFGTGAAIYLFAVDLIMNTATLAWLATGRAGVALWRGGLAVASAVPPDHPTRRQGCHRNPRRRQLASPVLPGLPGDGGRTPRGRVRQRCPTERPAQRYEVRQEYVGLRESERADTAATPGHRWNDVSPGPAAATASAIRGGWTEPATATQPSYAIYRPRTENRLPPESPAGAEQRAGRSAAGTVVVRGLLGRLGVRGAMVSGLRSSSWQSSASPD